MSTSQETVRKVRSILDKLDRSIDDARDRRTRRSGAHPIKEPTERLSQKAFEEVSPPTSETEKPRLARRIQPRGFDG